MPFFFSEELEANSLQKKNTKKPHFLNKKEFNLCHVHFTSSFSKTIVLKQTIVSSAWTHSRNWLLNCSLAAYV